MMKMSIEICNGYTASLCRCVSCGYEVLFIMGNRRKIVNCVCPVCDAFALSEVETPWVGLIEKVIE